MNVGLSLSYIHLCQPQHPFSGAPWVSQAANKRIAQAAKAAIETDKIENLLSIILWEPIEPNAQVSVTSMFLLLNDSTELQNHHLARRQTVCAAYCARREHRFAHKAGGQNGAFLSASR